MRAFFLALLLACRGAGDEAVVESGPLLVRAALAPDPPRQEDETLRLKVEERDGSAVEGARVQVRASMPAMGAMPAMEQRADVRDLGGGRYDAVLDLPMGGTWTVDVEVSRDGTVTAASYRFTVGARGILPGV